MAVSRRGFLGTCGMLTCGAVLGARQTTSGDVPDWGGPVLDTHLHPRGDFESAWVHMQGSGVSHAILRTRAGATETVKALQQRHPGRFLWTASADLTKPEAAWIVRLIDDTGNETAPEEIIAIRRPNALERTYYPYNTVWRQPFRIRFPRVTADGRPTISPRARWFGLRFAGAQGNTELVWQIDGDDAGEVERRTASLRSPR